MPVRALHHVGMTVSDVRAARDFFTALLEIEPLFVGRLDRPYLGATVGHPGVAMDGVLFELPGGTRIELLEYLVEDRQTLPDDTKHPGNVHLCLAVEDIDEVWARAVSLGARPVRPDGPTLVDSGPNRGAKAAYLRVLDGATLELFQPPPAA